VVVTAAVVMEAVGMKAEATGVSAADVEAVMAVG
jgi:hypothetical protein